MRTGAFASFALRRLYRSADTGRLLARLWEIALDHRQSRQRSGVLVTGVARLLEETRGAGGNPHEKFSCFGELRLSDGQRSELEQLAHAVEFWNEIHVENSHGVLLEGYVIVSVRATVLREGSKIGLPTHVELPEVERQFSGELLEVAPARACGGCLREVRVNHFRCRLGEVSHLRVGKVRVICDLQGVGRWLVVNVRRELWTRTWLC
jgi:hypothetical protein